MYMALNGVQYQAALAEDAAEDNGGGGIAAGADEAAAACWRGWCSSRAPCAETSAGSATAETTASFMSRVKNVRFGLVEEQNVVDRSPSRAEGVGASTEKDGQEERSVRRRIFQVRFTARREQGRQQLQTQEPL